MREERGLAKGGNEEEKLGSWKGRICERRRTYQSLFSFGILAKRGIHTLGIGINLATASYSHSANRDRMTILISSKQSLSKLYALDTDQDD